MYTLSAIADETKTHNPVVKSSVKLNAHDEMVRGLKMVVINAIGSQDPKSYGTVMIAIAPSIAGYGVSFSRPDLYSASAMIGSLGLYNRNILAKNDYSKSEVFKRNMAVMVVMRSAVFFGSYFIDKAKLNSETTDVSLQFDGKNTLLTFNKFF